VPTTREQSRRPAFHPLQVGKAGGKLVKQEAPRLTGGAPREAAWHPRTQYRPQDAVKAGDPEGLVAWDGLPGRVAKENDQATMVFPNRAEFLVDKFH
jgi:hypothetical protein